MRFAFFAVFLCVGGMAFCQSTPPASANPEAAGRNPTFGQPWADFSKLPPEMSFSNTAQLDLKKMLRAPALNVQAQPLLLAQNGFPNTPKQSEPGPKAKLIPIPIEWRNAAVKRIPTEWPNLKLQKAESQSSKSELGRA